MSFSNHDTLLPILALAAVLCLIILAGRAARIAGLNKSRSNNRISLSHTLALDRVRRIHIVRCDDLEFLLLTGGSQDLVLSALPPKADAP